METKELATLTTDRLEETLQSWDTVVARIRALQMEVLNELDLRQVPMADGSRNLAEWTASRLDVAPETAQKLTRTGRRLADQPELAADLQSGRVSFDRTVEESRLVYANLNEEIEEINRRMRQLQRRVDNIPKREQELLSLKRDHQNIQNTYNSLLNRKLEAEIAVNMERKQKGEQFRIIDYAKVPQRPVEPDMKKLFMFVVAAGLGIGGGCIFLLEFLDTSFRKP